MSERFSMQLNIIDEDQRQTCANSIIPNKDTRVEHYHVDFQVHELIRQRHIRLTRRVDLTR